MAKPATRYPLPGTWLYINIKSNMSGQVEITVFYIDIGKGELVGWIGLYTGNDRSNKI